MPKTKTVRTTIAAILAGLAMSAQAIADTQRIDIPAGSLLTALAKLAEQANVDLVYQDAQLEGLRTGGVAGDLSAYDAVVRLLQGTPLKVRTDAASGAIVITLRAAGAPTNSSVLQEGAREQSPTVMQLEEIVVKGIPEVLVKGSRSVNADIERTEDDVQPYVVFDREEIARSMVNTPEEFLKTRLPMNAVQGTFTQALTNGAVSSINLRGLGANQTLILLNGRRMAGLSSQGVPFQSDINGIPLNSIERIEVLPATASGIYGGGATGGVINVITRKDYAGFELSASYGSAFRGDADNYRFDGSAGFGLEEGRTHAVISLSRAESDPLLWGDRDFVARARARQLANNPNAFYSLTTPPAGYTSNICAAAANRCTTTPLVLDNGTPLNSSRTHIPVGYAGPSTDGGAALLANAGTYNLTVPDDLNGTRRSALLGTTVTSAMLNVRREFTDRLEMFADFSWLENASESLFASVPSSVMLAANAANNPFQQAILVTFPATGLAAQNEIDTRTIQAVGGLIYRLPARWTVSADYAWNRVRFSDVRTNDIVGDPDAAGPGRSCCAGNNSALSSGTLDVMRDLNAFALDWSPYLLDTPNRNFLTRNTQQNANLRLSGPIFDMPGGSVTLSSVVEWREEEQADGFSEIGDANNVRTTSYLPSRSQSVTSYYLESHVPLFSNRNALPALSELELQASARYDNYETRAPDLNGSIDLAPGAPIPAVSYLTNEVSATKYTAGFRYKPLRDVTLRASYGTGFLPPSVQQLAPNVASTNSTVTLTDAKRGGVSANVGPITRQGGGNLDLSPESSESLSLGLIFTPTFLPGLRLSADYTEIKKRDEIASISDQQILDLEDLLPGRVTRNELTADDAARGYTAGTITRIDRRLLNVSATKVEAYDFQIDYDFSLGGLGNFRVFTVATWQPTFRREVVPNTAFVDFAGYSAAGSTVFPLEWRGNVGLLWDRGPWNVAWNTQYYDSYFAYQATALPPDIAAAVLNQGSEKIESQIFHDLSVRYRFGASAGFLGDALDNVEVTLAVQNIFDQRPAVLATTASVQGGYSTYADPRLRRFSLGVRKTF